MDVNGDDPALEELRSLLSASALDALEADDDLAVEAGLAARPELAAELADLRDAAAWLGIDAAHEAPAGLEARILDAALGTRRSGRHLAVDAAGVPDAADALAGEADDLAELLTDLAPDAWSVPTRAGLTVQELVGHLVGIEDYTGGLLGLWPLEVDPAVEIDHVETSRPAIEAARSLAPAELIARWHARARAVADGARPMDRTRRFTFHHLDLSLRSLLHLRTFELWVHGDDVRAAVGRPSSLGHPGRIHAMAAMVANGLPLALAMHGAPTPEGTVRLVLTGPGGGTWQAPLRTGGDAAGEPVVELVADVHDFCRLVGHRLEPGALGAAVRGDQAVADAVLAAARIFAA